MNITTFEAQHSQLEATHAADLDKIGGNAWLSEEGKRTAAKEADNPLLKLFGIGRRCAHMIGASDIPEGNVGPNCVGRRL